MGGRHILLGQETGRRHERQPTRPKTSGQISSWKGSSVLSATQQHHAGRPHWQLLDLTPQTPGAGAGSLATTTRDSFNNHLGATAGVAFGSTAVVTDNAAKPQSADRSHHAAPTAATVGARSSRRRSTYATDSPRHFVGARDVNYATQRLVRPPGHLRAVTICTEPVWGTTLTATPGVVRAFGSAL